MSNINTHIISFNESEDVGYKRTENLSEFPSLNNKIKLTFLKFQFHEQEHIIFTRIYNNKIYPRFLLDDNFELIDNKYFGNTDNDISDARELGKAF